MSGISGIIVTSRILKVFRLLFAVARVCFEWQGKPWQPQPFGDDASADQQC